jgi:hypothetical protein
MRWSRGRVLTIRWRDAIFPHRNGTSAATAVANMEVAMNDADAQQAKGKLDAALARMAPTVGIAFGPDLFDEFRQRGWLTLEQLSVLGTTIFKSGLPAYDHTHFAFMSWDVPDSDFRVGAPV